MATGPLEGLSYFIKQNQDMGEFLRFCLEGEPGDENGDPKPGVLHWLRQLGVKEANFFTATSPAKMFCASVSFNGADWLEIKGFMKFVESGGTKNLSLPPNGQIKLKSEKELDDAYRATKDVFVGLSAEEEKKLKAALRGDKGTNLKAVIEELSEPDRPHIREAFDKASFEKVFLAPNDSASEQK
jgi:hypothetical protein